MLTQARLKELLNYDPETGIFTWIKKAGCRSAGDEAGFFDSHGHRQIGVDGKFEMAHRLAFLWMTGRFPDGHVDHRNRVRGDNRWENLRPASRLLNNRNAGLRKDNSSGVKGISWAADRKKWIAQISYRGKQRYLGAFEVLEDAKEFIELAREICHGEFACHGVAL